MRGRPKIPLVCYEKLDDGSEAIIEIFRCRQDAIDWAKDNKIMCKGAIDWTIKNNTYISKTSVAVYHNRDRYRFAKLNQS